MRAGSCSRHSEALWLLSAGILIYVFLSGTAYFFKNAFGLENATFLILNSLSEALAFGGTYLLLKDRLDLNFRLSGKSLLQGLAAWISTFLLTQAYFFSVRLLGLKPDFHQREIFEGIGSPAQAVAAFVSVAIFSPLFEELYFRGVLFLFLRDKYGFFIPAFVSSALFGILHGAFYFVPLFLFGFILCYLTERTGSLGAALFAHGLNNALAFFYYLYLSGG